MRYDPPLTRSIGLTPALIGLGCLLLYPWLFEQPYARHLLILAFIYAIIACSWDLSLGYAGLFNFAHVALFALGLYTYGVLAKTLGLLPWLAIPAGGLVAAGVAALMTLPVRRLDGIYVILVTIAVAQLLYQLIISQSHITGGTSGMVTLPALSIGDYRFTRDGRLGYYYTGLALMLVCCLSLYGITRSRFGRALLALKHHKFYAIARGVAEGRMRLFAMTTSAFFAGVAGSFYGSYVRVASPDAFGLGALTLVLSMLLVGGAGTLWGPLLAAFGLVILAEWLADFGAWREIVLAGIIISVMVFYPGGLWGAVSELYDFIDVRLNTLRARWLRQRCRAQRETLLGCPEQRLKTAHGDIAFVDSAPGRIERPVLLMLHGNSACKEAFVEQFAALADRYRLIAFDLPGHGASHNADPEDSYNIPAYADVAEAVLERCGVHRAALLGWSLGGYVALELAARAQTDDRFDIAGLVLTGTPPLLRVPEDFGRGYDPDSALILAGRRYFTRHERRRYADAATAPQGPRSEYLHRNLSRTDGRARFYMLTRLGVVDWPRQMRLITEGTLPLAILNGDDDPFLLHDYFNQLTYAALWRGEPQRIEGGKHAPFLNRPETYNTLLERFLREAGEMPATARPS